MTTPAGWHPDPEYPGQLRYWDGVQWTEDRALAPLSDPQPSRPKHRGKVIAAIVVGVLAVVLVVGAIIVVGSMVYFHSVDPERYEGTWRVTQVDGRSVDDPDDTKHVFEVNMWSDDFYSLDATADYAFMEFMAAREADEGYLYDDDIEVRVEVHLLGDTMTVEAGPVTVEAERVE
jgi:hypothetical protein